MELCIDLELPAVVRNKVLILPKPGKKVGYRAGVTDPARRLLALKMYLDYQARNGKDSIERKWTWGDEKIEDYDKDEPSDPELAAFKRAIKADLDAVTSAFRKRNKRIPAKKEAGEKGSTPGTGKEEKQGEVEAYVLKANPRPRDLAYQIGPNWNVNNKVRKAAPALWKRALQEITRNYPHVPGEQFGLGVGLASRNDSALDLETRVKIKVAGAWLRVEAATAFANFLRALNLKSFLRASLEDKKFELLVAVPGTSRHGVGGAYDFQVYKEEKGAPKLIAGIGSEYLVTWDTQKSPTGKTWKEELNHAINHPTKPTTGQFDAKHLQEPYEPWHYNYKHPYLAEE
jgi:hypothetical protein